MMNRVHAARRPAANAGNAGNEGATDATEEMIPTWLDLNVWFITENPTKIWKCPKSWDPQIFQNWIILVLKPMVTWGSHLQKRHGGCNSQHGGFNHEKKGFYHLLIGKLGFIWIYWGKLSKQ
jgi:hypothetical protein